MREDTTKMDPFSAFLLRHPQMGEQVLKLNWEGQKLLDSGRTKAAERKFREATQICECAVPALNNLALCASLRGDIQRAIRTAHQALEYHPTNVFAHCTLAECYEELGQTKKACSHIERAIALLEDPAVPLDKLPKVIEALARLQWDEKIDQVYRSYQEGVGFEEALDGISWFYIGVAAINLGRVEEALALWDRAKEEEPRLGLPDLYTTAALLIQEGKAPPFRFSYRFRKEGESLDPKHPSEEIRPVVVEGIWQGQEDMRHSMVELLGMWEDAWAEAFLRLMLTQSELSDDLKTHAAGVLIERGVLAGDEEVEMHIGGKKRTVVLNRREIPREPPPEAAEQFERGLSCRQAGKITQAEEAYRKALKVAPYFSEAMVNLANICRITDRSEEGERLLRKAVDLEASPTAILNLAALCLQQDREEEGRDLLSQVSISDLDEGVLPLYHLLCGYLDLSDGEFASAREAFQQLLDIQPEDKMAKDLLTRAKLGEEWERREMVHWIRRRDRYLSHPVDPGMPLVTALSTLTKDNLIGMALWHEVPYGILRKAELAERLAEYLRAHATRARMELSPEGQETLEWLLAEGGSTSLTELMEEFGSTEEDSIDWRYDPPLSPIGELQLAGLVFVGKDKRGETIAIIPRELQTKFQRGV
ncbi:tetratricopeptide repeat protein [Candidatus Bipolaricaulota bacterium]|nr:tetratricopeptide repeat protein [Candidatus Bipolaricaulota bacterium]